MDELLMRESCSESFEESEMDDLVECENCNINFEESEIHYFDMKDFSLAFTVFK